MSDNNCIIILNNFRHCPDTTVCSLITRSKIGFPNNKSAYPIFSLANRVLILCKCSSTMRRCLQTVCFKCCYMFRARLNAGRLWPLLRLHPLRYRAQRDGTWSDSSLRALRHALPQGSKVSTVVDQWHSIYVRSHSIAYVTQRPWYMYMYWYIHVHGLRCCDVADVRFLEEGRLDEAEAEKHRVENLQRERRKRREAEKSVYTPKWFLSVSRLLF